MTTPLTMVEIISAVCRRVGIAPPTAAASSTDDQIIQLLALLNEEVEDLATGSSVGLSYDWTALQVEASFVTVATEDQGAIETIAPGFKYMIPETIWNRSTRLPAYGGLSPQEWQAFKAWGTTNPYPRFRLQGGNLLLTPTPTAGDTFYFEYQSSCPVTSADGLTLKAWFTADTDISLLDDRLLISGLLWRWKSTKGLEYAEDFRKYQTKVTGAIERDGSKPTISMGGARFASGIVVPIGDWNA